MSIPNLARGAAALKKLPRHPIFFFVLLVVLCRIGMPRWEAGNFRMDKEFYPLNSFPMYADPGPEPSEYLVTTDGEGKPVSWANLTGDSTAKVKKKLTATRNRICSERGIKEATKAPPEVWREAWRRVVEGLQNTAKLRKKTLPSVLRLTWFRIYQNDATFQETSEVIAEVRIDGETVTLLP